MPDGLLQLASTIFLTFGLGTLLYAIVMYFLRQLMGEDPSTRAGQPSEPTLVYPTPPAASHPYYGHPYGTPYPQPGMPRVMPQAPQGYPSQPPQMPPYPGQAPWPPQNPPQRRG